MSYDHNQLTKLPTFAILTHLTLFNIHHNKGTQPMALTKADLVESIQAKLSLPKNQSSDLVESLLENIKSTLESGEDVMISGFGKFQVQHKKKRRGRNPATGADLVLDARKVVGFKCSGKLRERINDHSD